MNIDIENLSISQAHKHLKAGDITALQLTEACLEQVAEKNADINAYLEVFGDAREQAKAAQKFLEMDSCSPLAGIPMAIKDNIMIKGRICSSASKVLENYHATYDARVIEHLKQAGSVFVGRTNLDEFAMGGSTENSAFGITKNPQDTTRVAGGSSGGSAAAVAMHGALGALGTDTGGSVREPAAFCGIVGMKSTFGTVSRFGTKSLGSSLDQVGEFGKTVEDVELIYSTIASYDDREGTSVPHDIQAKYAKPMERKTIGIPVDFIYTDGVDQAVQDNFKQSLERLKQSGYSIKEISIPHMKYALAVYYIIMPAAASTNLARYDGVRYGLQSKGGDLLATYMKSRGEGFGPEVRRRIMLGTYVLSAGYYDAYYNKAERVREVIRKDFTNAFSEVDIIALPTAPSAAVKIGEKSDPLSMYLLDLFTVSANITGGPAISVPSGVDGDGLPLGIQFMAPHFNEDRLFTIGRDFENAR